MAKLGKLNVEIGADTRNFKRGMKSSRDDLSRWAKSVRGMRSVASGIGSSIGKMGVLAGGGAVAGVAALGAGAAATAVSLGAMAKEGINMVGDQSDAAKKLGVTRNELITLQRAAEGVGIENDKLVTGFEKMSDVLGSAFRGDTGAKKAIESVGLSVESIWRMKPTERFMALGRAINDIPDPAARLAASRDIFGKAGGDMTLLFDGAGKAIKGAHEDLTRYGNLLSEVGQHGVEKAGDVLDSWKTLGEGIKTQLADEVSPLVVAVGNDLNKWLDSIGGVPGAMDKAVVALGKGADASEGLVNSGRAAFRTGKDIKDTVVEGGGGLLDKIPGGETIGKALTWNPIRDTVGAIYGKHKSDLALEAMQDKASRRMGGEGLTVKGKGLKYIEDAQTDMGKSYAEETGVVKAAASPGVVAQAAAEGTAVGSAIAERGATPKPMAGAWERVSGKPRIDEAPRNNASWAGDGGTVAAAVSQNPMARNEGAGQVEQKLDEQTNLLREVRDALRGGVQGRYS